jgi:uncharacterized BrkB/YihY/UPF0761 family membrane protein
MTQATEASPASDTTELASRAHRAREELVASLQLLEQRTKRIGHTAANASTTSGLLAGAAFSLWLGVSAFRSSRERARAARVHDAASLVFPQRRMPRKPSIVSVIVRAAFATVGFIGTGLLIRALGKRSHERQLPALPRGA